MVCSKCGHIIEEGRLYCSKCGLEVQVVPDFDAQVENEIDLTLSKLLADIRLEDITEEQFEELTKTMDLEQTRDLAQMIEKAKTRDLSPDEVKAFRERTMRNEAVRNAVVRKNKRIKMFIFAACSIIVLILIVFIGIAVSKANSCDSVYKKALIEAENENYSKAIKLFNEILEKDPSYYDATIGLEQALRLQGNYVKAEEILRGLIISSDASEEVKTTGYTELIKMYEEEGDYKAISEVLSECSIKEVLDEFKQYDIAPPVFDYEEGEYIDSLELHVINDNGATVYYTLDGSEPDENSEKYTDSIVLESGKNVVRAVCITDTGIRSDSVTKIFEITDTILDKPQISPEEGSFSNPVYIEVEEMPGCVIYYTSDGTMPDEDSKEYKYPLLMHLGDSTYRFVAINEQGKRSDISSVTYTLNCTTGCTETDAVNVVTASMLNTGRLVALDGTGSDGKVYKYYSIGIANIGAGLYYVISEKTEDASSDNKLIETGDYYSVDIISGEVGQAARNSDGYFYLK